VISARCRRRTAGVRFCIRLRSLNTNRVEVRRTRRMLYERTSYPNVTGYKKESYYRFGLRVALYYVLIDQ